MARAASPELAYRIGQHFKENKLKNEIDGGNRPEEQSANHLLAHAILGAVVSYATGNDIATGALAGATSEKTTPILATYLYGKDPKELSQEQKDTITSIISLGTAGIAYGATGNVSSAVSASEVGKVGVENNNWGGENWAYSVAGGKEYAQSQASLGLIVHNKVGIMQNVWGGANQNRVLCQFQNCQRELFLWGQRGMCRP
ncbi:VENN motif pre-toxin domain-containing protein [Moraxella sp.]|uniref:VENN motif pre-toxin domain-containing protein n=1 Tax=Moraxella sp. TaxID=479 RepID=UPI0026DD47D8|nr:VENN motif pre-toxin domain-containing protein [Moraxella sp.]MDO4895324.1 VENN motif pre-toxin domain-containing protein [Moraxella sp.]